MPRKRASLDAFREAIDEACDLISSSPHTRQAYRADASKWFEFCAGKKIDPRQAKPIHVVRWADAMRDEYAPKTRARRLAALASIYDHLRRHRVLDANPFSAAEGPKREHAAVQRPTPIAGIRAVAAALRHCAVDQSPEGLRDAAILRVLWATGARRSSLVQITRERLSQEDSGAYTCVVPAKGGKVVRLWFAGRAAEAVRRWTEYLDAVGIRSGAIFRRTTGVPMDEKDVWRAVRKRGALGGGGALAPHSLRVAFLTLNPASLDERQDAVGHARPETTRLYDKNWRGQRAFALMPEVEDVVTAEPQ